LPSHKKHHYVPKFHLKYFGFNNQKNICLYNLLSKKHISRAQLKNQAYEDYLYGKKENMEIALSNIERLTSVIFNKIISRNGNLRLSKKLYQLLIIYISIQMNRTIYAKDDFEKKYLEMIRTFSEIHPKYKNFVFNSNDIHFNGVSQYLIADSMKYVHLLFDLDYIILVNKTNREFIISDNPVVKYNMYMEFNNYPPGGTGYISKGLQLFLPISPYYYILLYDKNVYKPKYIFKKFIQITDINVVKNINGLQYLNSSENLYFSDKVSEGEILRIMIRFKNKKELFFNPVARYYPVNNTKGNESILHFKDKVIRINLSLNDLIVKKYLPKNKNDFNINIPRTKRLEKYLNMLEDKLENQNNTITLE
jgi:hypothetical protein